MMHAQMRDFRCGGDGCPDRHQCHRFRPLVKGEVAPVTALYVRRDPEARRCDQFIEKVPAAADGGATQ